MLGKGHDVPEFAEFWAAGEYRLPAGPAHFTLFEDFSADPVRSPLHTPSGRIEITSATIAGFGYPTAPGTRCGSSPTSGSAPRWPAGSRCT